MTSHPAAGGIAPPAQLTNMRLCLATLLECMEAPDGSPRMGLLYGPSGYGKSYAAAHATAHVDAAYIVAKSIWTQRSLLEAIAREIGIAGMARTGPKLLDQIIDQLLVEPQPLIVDETDHIVVKKSVEIIRDIHDNARVPILMIGEEKLPAKLKEWERFDNRILRATPAQPSNLSDALLLRDFYCQRVAVADDLVEAIVAATGGITRRIAINLQAAQAAALQGGTDAIDLAGWKRLGRAFTTGHVAMRRAA